MLSAQEAIAKAQEFQIGAKFQVSDVERFKRAFYTERKRLGVSVSLRLTPNQQEVWIIHAQES